MEGEKGEGKEGESGGNEKLQELLVDELRDLMHAEKQLVRALPKMSKAAHDPELKQSFDKHLQQTEGHVTRLEQVFEAIGEKARPKPCKGMMGLVSEGSEIIREGKRKEDVVADLALIAAAQRVEHYEIAGYGTARTIAEQMGNQEAARLLEETEQEEKQTDEILTNTAEQMYGRVA